VKRSAASEPCEAERYRAEEARDEADGALTDEFDINANRPARRDAASRSLVVMIECSLKEVFVSDA
jgi:hypothetical protein